MISFKDGIENTVNEVLANSAVSYGMKTALVDQSVHLTYADVERLSFRLASHLIRMGLKKGDVVAVQLPNSWEFAVTHLALARIGLIILPVNLMYRKKELAFMLSFAEAKAVVTIDKWKAFDHAALMDELKQELPQLQHIIVTGTEIRSGHHSFTTLLKTESVHAAEEELSFFTPRPEDKMLMMFTSGTESDPKAVVHTYQSFVPTHLQNAQEYQMSSHDTILCLTPMSHMFSLPMLIMGLKHGARQIMLAQFSVEKTLELIEREGVTFCVASPTHLIDLLKGTDGRERIASNLRLILTGGTKIPSQMVKELRQRLGCEIAAQWGMTELGGGTFTRPADRAELTWDTVGRVCPSGEVQIFDEEGLPVADGEVGEIGFRGLSLFAGYYKNEAGTKESFLENGFFLTGDLGWKDAEGYIHFVSRKKDTINRGGLKVHAAEIEEALVMHPKIKQAAVVSVPDERLGERGCAVVSFMDGETMSLEEVTEYLLRLGMAKYKLPEYLRVMDELPMTASGKISKGMLREEALAFGGIESRHRDRNQTGE